MKFIFIGLTLICIVFVLLIQVVMSNLKKSNSDNMFPYDGSSDSLYDEPMMSIHALLDCIWDGKKTTLETILM